MNKAIKNIIRDFLRGVLSPLIYTKIRFYLVHGYKLDLEKPKSFSEKIIKRKFDTNSYRFSCLVDKYTVRKYVKNKIGDSYLIPLIKTVNRLNQSDFDGLPESFVMKTSNGGGGENVLIVEDKAKLNIPLICKKFNGYLEEKIGTKIDEYFYDVETPMIIFEELIKHEDGRFPSDYKIHVFNGNEKNIIIQVDEDRFGNHKRSLFDENLKKLYFDIQPKYESVAGNYQFPINFSEMLELAKKLASDFKYVRVDMYNVDGQIYFGEMTFCHGSGWEPIKPKAADFMLGEYWDEYN